MGFGLCALSRDLRSFSQKPKKKCLNSLIGAKHCAGFGWTNIVMTCGRARSLPRFLTSPH
ncbi:hypothetical protein BCR44DRAFT_1438205 [Catenaria anguillulae PL171]|uniref:Uncharacterized protein n=1 Tax=Catenaria anguillulae PL171 TaxID=765915 RepID=A0A1Y2HG39_9FUNG|nr:hypothetical protein BCR44DRAFT_1438205 [Catenaria anguillulae PL171]